jgi:hypothetical protein
LVLCLLDESRHAFDDWFKDAAVPSHPEEVGDVAPSKFFEHEQVDPTVHKVVEEESDESPEDVDA